MLRILFGLLIVLVLSLLINFLLSIFVSPSSDKGDVEILKKDNGDKRKIDPDVGEVTDYEEVE